MANTIIQLTNFSLIEKFIDYSKFIENNDITPTSLDLISNLLKESLHYLDSDIYKTTEKTIQLMTKINSQKFNK